MASVSQPFALDIAFENPALRRLWPLVQASVERIAGFTELGEVYRRSEQEPTIDAFLSRSLRELGIGWETIELDMARVPRSGGCIVVANHPFGAVEGIVLAALLRRVRPDVKLIANYLLARIAPLREMSLFVDPFGRAGSAQANLAAMRSAVRFLRRGGMVAIFPAGEVAHLDLKTGAIVDPPWNESVARLVRLSKAPVLPVYFHGHNGAMFQIAGLMHPRLRTALLPRELLNKRHHVLEVRVGATVAARKLASFSEDRDLVAYLRRRTTMLAERSPGSRRPANQARSPLGWVTWPSAVIEPVAPPIDPARLVAEVDALPQNQILVEENNRVACWARAPQIPAVLSEIGRLRELTFREAREGTGRAFDLDAFDRSYLHLFVFDRRDRAVVGAYRLGPTDELLARGPAALYTNTLFRMNPELFQRMGPALEMGRSFVCARYQRTAAGLFLLWRGIGQFVAQRPQYGVLFGPVSISNAYAPISRELMVDFIETGDHMHPWGRYVRPRRPFARRRRASIASGLPLNRFLCNIEEVSSLVADLEPDQKGVPILFRQYLKLGGKMLGFNVDPAFSGVLDGLVLVDVRQTDFKTLARYFGTEQADAFLAYHRVERLRAG